MKVSKIETLRLKEFANLCWVQVHTDEGVVGLGETFMGAAAVEAYIHETVAPYLLGKDPLQIDRHWRELYGYLGFRSTGVEMRGNSAVDIALWDLWGKATNQPVYQLLGGKCRDSIRTYNTCAGYNYIRTADGQKTGNFGLPAGEALGPYEDLEAFLYRADELAESLLAEGITAMKIWPFDSAAEASNGQSISNSDLDKALEPFAKIRDAVGNRMEIMVECHSLWNLPSAIKISRALEPYQPTWIEDPVKMDSLSTIQEFRQRTTIPVCASETIATRWGYRDLLEKQATDFVMPDLGWVGGISEAKKVATMAEAWHLPLAPHDCTGPVVFAASCHLSINAPNAVIQESVRALYTGWYTEVMESLPVVSGGMIRPPEGPGLGTELKSEVFERADAVRVISE
ncbi:MAG: mandelate racemase/muconate lactonizing enzyme family protein [Halioglobus sp.]|nr:mandelate racemase/muconate lactonizing enzyme family protein [Halioglobus sp.]